MSKTVLILAVPALLISTAPVLAQNTVRVACMPDIRKHCSPELATFSRENVRACLIKNIKRTSPACQEAAKARQDAERAKKAAS